MSKHTTEELLSIIRQIKVDLLALESRLLAASHNGELCE